MNKLAEIEILKEDFTSYGVEFTNKTILNILKVWDKDYNSLQKELIQLTNKGLTNEQIAKELKGHNIPKHAFEDRICDLNYKSILTTIYPNNKISEYITGYLDTEEIKAILNSVKEGQSTICSDFMYEYFSIEVIREGIKNLETSESTK